MTMNDNIKLHEYHSFLKSIRQWMLFAGIWPSAKPNIAYRLIPFICMTSNILLSIVLFRFAIFHHSNVGLMVKGVSLGTSFVSTGLKVFIFTLYRKSAVELSTILENYHREYLDNENLRHFILERVTGFRRLSWILSILVAIGALVYVVSPIILIIIQIRHHAQSIKYILPTPALYPWTIHPGGLIYKFTYLFETYNLACLYSVASGVDSLFAYYVFHIIGQLRILNYQVTSIDENDNYHKIIRACVTKYEVLMKCCDILQKIYGPIILWIIVTNSVIICTVLFQMSQAAAISIGKIFLIIGYGGSKVLQTYIYAWAGSALTSESEVFMESAYFSNWPILGRKNFNTSILIMLSQRPLTITAASCLRISMDMFVMTMNTTLSYFFLLKTLEEKQS